MNLFFILAIIFAADSFALWNDFQLPNVELEGRITLGSKAAEGQFPYQVGLYMNGSNPNVNWCGGCLIGREWVLTAAHCLIDADSVFIYLGSTVRLQAEQIRYATKKDFIIHHFYNGTNLWHDIALIKMPSVALSEKIKIIELPSILNETPSSYQDTFAIASGWGRISDDNLYVGYFLRWARLKIISSNFCKMAYPAVANSTVCIETVDGRSPCNGDSGGPLASEAEGLLIGTFSFLSTSGCELGYPVGYVRVTDYLDWIYLHTGIYY